MNGWFSSTELQLKFDAHFFYQASLDVQKSYIININNGILKVSKIVQILVLKLICSNICHHGYLKQSVLPIALDNRYLVQPKRNIFTSTKVVLQKAFIVLGGLCPLAEINK